MLLIRCAFEFKLTFIKDDGRCLGAFHVGCQADQTEAPTEDPTQEPTTTMPESQCTLAKNTLGECGCGKQLFVGDECKKVIKGLSCRSTSYMMLL